MVALVRALISLLFLGTMCQPFCARDGPKGPSPPTHSRTRGCVTPSSRRVSFFPRPNIIILPGPRTPKSLFFGRDDYRRFKSEARSLAGFRPLEPSALWLANQHGHATGHATGLATGRASNQATGQPPRHAAASARGHRGAQPPRRAAKTARARKRAAAPSQTATGAARSPRATTAEHSSRERDSPSSHAPTAVHKKQQTPQLSARAEAFVPKLKPASASTLSVEALCWWPWWGSFWARLTATTRDHEGHPAHRDGRISASKRGMPVVGRRHGADQIVAPLGVKILGPYPLSGPQGKCKKTLLKTNPFLDPPFLPRCKSVCQRSKRST